MKLLSLLLSVALVVSCGRAERSQTQAAAERREAAYRANNRGVGLLEQFAYDRAVAAFQEALQIDPAVRLARINLAIALFYAGRPEEAAASARAAQLDYPDAPEPAYLLGLIARGANQRDEAIRQFERVLRVDRDDPGARVQLAMVLLDERRYQDAVTLAESAVAIEPYNATAAYTVAMALTRMGDQARAGPAMRRFEQLRTAPYAITYSQSYLEQGRYAEALASSGAEPGLVNAGLPAVTFADATAEVFGTPAAGSGNSSSAVALADLDGDEDLDVLAGGPSLRILRNDRPRFVDAGATLLRGPVTSVGRIVPGDINNDARADLLVLTAAGAYLLTQAADGRFDRSAAPIIRAPLGPQTAALVDVDHDGDLDVFAGGEATVLLRNNGNSTFTDVTTAAGLRQVRGIAAVAPMDFDNRRDVDLVAVAPGSPLMIFRNLRTGAFEEVGAAVGAPPADHYTSLAAGDVNKDGFTDLLLGRAAAPWLWLLSDRAGRFRASEAPAARGVGAALLFDYDNDGLLDLFVTAADGPHLFRNTGGAWQEHAGATAAVRAGLPPDAVVTGIAAGDLDRDGDTDVVATLPGGALRLWRNLGGNANPSVQVTLAGRASNRLGVGAKVEVRAGGLYQRIETIAATPPVTPADVTFGLGARAGADVIRVLWPSGVLQTEFPASSADARVARVALTELDRKPSSCPYLYTWNGERFEFVTDFMGGGEMGYLEAPPDHRNIPDPDEYVRITDTQLRERNGRLEIRVTNELEEVLFLDHLALVAVSHPADTAVFPDEGMRVRPRPFRTYTVHGAQPPRAAVDEHGHDVLPRVARLDRRFVDDFALTAVRGYAGDHALIIDLAGHPPRAGSARTLLLLTGWTDYAFSTDNVSAHQAGLTLIPPTLQVETSTGAWQTVDADVGIPVGRPQTLVLDVTSYAPRRVRVLTSMRVYWDQVLLATAASARPALLPIPLRAADLRWRGFSKAISIDGHALSYDYASVSETTPWKLMPGRYTREGDVRALVEAADDRFVISRPGDELALSFDASALPPVEPGMRRTFLLYSVGFSKEMDLHSASPDVVEPIPFRAMSRYPYTSPERYPHQHDMVTFHTRRVPRALSTLRSEASR